jgi:hypothetical protein
VDTGDAYRAELRAADGKVQGIYSWLNPDDGSPHLISYVKDSAGQYRSVGFNQLGISLPPFPYSMQPAHFLSGEDDKIGKPYGALAQHMQIQKPTTYNYDDVEVVESSQPQQNSLFPPNYFGLSYKNQYQGDLQEDENNGDEHEGEEQEDENHADEPTIVDVEEIDNDNGILIGHEDDNDYEEEQGGGGLGPGIISDLLGIEVDPGIPTFKHNYCNYSLLRHIILT